MVGVYMFIQLEYGTNFLAPKFAPYLNSDPSSDSLRIDFKNVTNTFLTTTNVYRQNEIAVEVSKDFPPPELEKISLADFLIEEHGYFHDDQYLKYKHCPTNVRLRIQNSTALRHKYIEDMPILLWDKHLNEEEYRRLYRFRSIYGFSNMSYKDLASTIYKLNVANSHYMFDDRIGKDGKEIGNCIKCAIIGNGGILNGSGKGEEIDAHDYVFRVNTALTEGFEKDVGSKTSFYCFTMITLFNTLRGSSIYGFKSPPYQEGIRYLFFADSLWTYTYLGAAFSGKKLPSSTDKYHRKPIMFPVKLTPDIVKIVHPDFERYLKYSWINSTNQNMNIHRLTTGAIMLLAALHTCDEVNAYGFGGSSDKYSEHYYEKHYKKKINFGMHDDYSEMKLWHLLNKEQIISLYTRD